MVIAGPKALDIVVSLHFQMIIGEVFDRKRLELCGRVYKSNLLSDMTEEQSLHRSNILGTSRHY